MAIKITREQLDEYREMLERKRDIEVQHAAINEAISQFEANVRDQMVADKKTMTTRFDWVFSLERGNLSVAWKKAFIAARGNEEAIKLVNLGKGKGKVKLNVTPPQDLEHLFAQAESEE